MRKSTSLEESRKRIAAGGDPGEPPTVDDGDGGGGGDDLVKVAFAPNQMEAEMIQGLLRDHDIPSLLKRGPGFDVPEFMTGGPRQIFVRAADAAQAREALAGTPGVS